MQKLKTEKSLRNLFYAAKMKMNLQKRNNLRTRECLQGSYPRGMFNPLGISDEFLFRNDFNDQKMHFFKQGRFCHTQGNHFPVG